MRAIRVLWADDQEDVARTLSAVLDRSYDVRHVKDGELALKQLLAVRFDLAVVDLSMPPGEWGGLWLLERLRDMAVDVPVLVLSGEGSQSETIAAMRLGADYVRKEDATSELPSRVASILIDSAEQRHVKSEAELPFPVAVPYRRMRTSGTAVERLRRSIETAEAAVRYRAIVSLSELLRSGGHLAAGDVLRLRKPSFGAWLQVAQDSTKKGRAGSVLTAVNWNQVQRAVRLRNDVSHGTEPSEESAAEAYVWMQDVIDELIWGLVSHQLVCPRTLQYDGAVFKIDALVLGGCSPTLKVIQLQRKNPLVSDNVYVVFGDAALSLDPWIRLERSTNATSWRVLVFDTIQWDGRADLTGDEALRYADVWSGDRNVVSPGGTSGTLAGARKVI